MNGNCPDEKPVWLVTGAAHGVGRILAEMALRHGNRVVATSERLEDLWPLVDDYADAVIPIELDIDDESADRETVQRVIEILGRLDVVVNAAGYDRDRSADDTLCELQRVQSNLFGALWISRAALVYMSANAGGRIIQVFGLDNYERYRNRRLYETSRRSLVEFSEHLAREVAPFDVQVSVCVSAMQYWEWSDVRRVQSFTLEVYDLEDVEIGSLFSGEPAASTRDRSQSAQALVSPIGESSTTSPVSDPLELDRRRVDSEIRNHCCERGEACI